MHIFKETNGLFSNHDYVWGLTSDTHELNKSWECTEHKLTARESGDTRHVRHGECRHQQHYRPAPVEYVVHCLY